MEILLVIAGVVVLAAVIAYTHHTRKGQAIVSPHRVSSEGSPPGARGPSEVDRDRGDYPAYGQGTR